MTVLRRRAPDADGQPVDRHSWVRMTVGAKFLCTVGVLVATVVAVVGIGAISLARTSREAQMLFSHSLATTQGAAALGAALDDVHMTELRRSLAATPAESAELTAELDRVLVPKVWQELTVLRQSADDSHIEGDLDAIKADFERYLTLRRAAPSASPPESAAQEVDAAGAPEYEVVFDRMSALTDEIRAEEVAEAQAFELVANSRYTSTRLLLVGLSVLSLVGGLAAVLLLIRNLVPRIRKYAHFATEVAAGRAVGRLQPRGHDELAELGAALNDLVAQSERLSSREAAQVEYVDTLQVTATEEEAHELVQRHIERSVTGSSAVVLQRNNSANRLEAATALPPDSRVGERLIGAEPRACLGVRFARTHCEGSDRSPLLNCTLCTGGDMRATCEPLLVGGEVIGSVLVNHPQPLDKEEEGRIKTSVAQAAPVLANLRNLALAQFRANNDPLTGLPNKRATDDTIKRMVAQANRSVAPLAAVMLDLDHFKQINDRFGHGKGDEVLAAVGAAIRASLRASDFAGRFGGEEFLILLPDTPLAGAHLVAEKIRSTLESIQVVGVEREITASLGIAGLLEHAGTPQGLLHEADRALYAAKAAGRNRTVIAAAITDDEALHDQATTIA